MFYLKLDKQLTLRAHISCFEKQFLRCVGKTKRDFAKAVNIHDQARTQGVQEVWNPPDRISDNYVTFSIVNLYSEGIETAVCCLAILVLQ